MRIKILGDSIAAGQGCRSCRFSDEIIIKTYIDTYPKLLTKDSWSDLLSQSFYEHEWVNLGCRGITTFELLAHLDELIDDQDDVILLMIGANNRKYQDGMILLENDLRSMIDTVHNLNKKIIIMTQSTSTPENEMKANRIYHMPQVNEIIRKVSYEKKCFFIDLDTLLLTYAKDQGLDYVSLFYEEGCKSDGLHPTSQLQSIMATCITPALQSIFSSLEDSIYELAYYPYYMKKASNWFSSKWNISLQAYEDSFKESMLRTNPVPSWYIMTSDNEIIAGCGIIQNDFHAYKQYEPNLCALYVDEQVRRQGKASKLIERVRKQCLIHGIENIYLLTSHTDFYEHLGFEYIDTILDDEQDEVRVYHTKISG